MSQFYDLPLEHPPIPALLAIGRHGSLALKQYLIPDSWCLHLYRDPMQLRVSGQWLPVEAGCATLIPPGAPIEFHFPAPTLHTHFVAHFRASTGQTRAFPALQNLGARFEPLYQLLIETVASGARDDAELPRAQARLWDVLWQLSQPAPTSATPQQTLVESAQKWIEAHLGESFSIGELARQFDVSHNHLTRCFRAQTEQTPVAWTRARRIERARYLLEHTTAPIKSIAAQSGLGDIHSLNKAMRGATGQGPRALRMALQTQIERRL